MRDATPSVLIVDDDPEFRDSDERLLRSVGLHTQQFSSVADFLKAGPSDGPTCLVLDIRMPGGSGLELQRDLAAANREVPIIFITAHADIPMTVQAMKGGAIEFLTKPFPDQDLLDAVESCLARDRARRENDKALGAIRERFETLSSREREIMIQVTGRSPEQTDCGRYRHRRIYGEGASHQPDEKGAGAFASRAQPNGGYPQAWTKTPATLLTRRTDCSKRWLSVFNKQRIRGDPRTMARGPQHREIGTT
jgi:FixJ family two-component response regulator